MESLNFTNSTEEEGVCQTALPLLTILRDIVLILITTVVTIISAKLTFRKQSLWDLLNNCMFWVFLLYFVAIVVTLLRFPFMQLCILPKEYFTILYNWAASLIIWVSGIMPYKLLKVGTKTTTKEATSNLKLVLMCVVLFVVLLGATIGAAYADIPITGILKVWRIFTIFNIFVELILLVTVLTNFKGTTLEANFRWYLACTLWMRGGIAVSLVIKYFELIPTVHMKLIHMIFVISGLVLYNRKFVSAISTKVAPLSSAIRRGSATLSSTGPNGSSSRRASNGSSSASPSGNKSQASS